MDPADRPPEQGLFVSWANALVHLALELRRRKVVRVTLFYLTGAMVVLASGDALFETFPLPAGAQPLLGWTLLAGLPVAVALAWFFDWTEDGLRMADHRRVPLKVRRGVLVATLLGAVGLGTAAFLALPRAAPPASGPIYLAVLPFEAASPADAHLAIGLQSGVEQALSGIPALNLIPGATTGQYPGMPLDSLARRVGADYFLQATLLAGARAVDLQVLSAGDAVVRDADRVEVRPTSPDALEGTLADSLELNLRRLLRREITLTQWDRGTASNEAFEARLRAEKALQDAAPMLVLDPPGFRALLDQADSLLTVAGRHDRAWPEVAVARALVAERRSMGAAVEHGAAEAVAALDAGLALVDRFLAQRPGVPAVLEARGRLRLRRYSFGKDAGQAQDPALLDAAEADLRAAAQDPRLASAAARLAELYRYERGDYQLARHWALRAWERDAYLEERPLVLTVLADTHLELAEDEEAARWCRMLGDGYPHMPPAHSCVLELMAWGGAEPRPEAAWAALEVLAGMRGGQGERAGYHGFLVASALARAGLADSARAVVARSRAATRHDEALWLEAAVLFRLGDTARAAALLRDFGTRHPDQVATVFRKRALRDYAIEP